MCVTIRAAILLITEMSCLLLDEVLMLVDERNIDEQPCINRYATLGVL